jgi:predicted MPP superfamily phosphohydrolase
VAIIGNHDVAYGEDDINTALQAQGIAVLDDERHIVEFAGSEVVIAGLPDAKVDRPSARALLSGLPPNAPAIILTHDPVWFGEVTSPSHVTLAGHTHGGQIRLPFLGALTNQSRAPLRWTHGLIVEEGRHLYVTSGLGTSGVPLRIGIAPEYLVLDINGRAA